MPSPGSDSRPFPWRFVSAMSFTQLVSYGTLFYAFALFIEPMERDLGWSKAALTGAYSLALVSSAFFAVPVGRLIDAGHGRAVMTAGSVATAILVALWARTDSYLAFVLVWIGLGAAMSAVLYEAGFAVLALHLGLLTRRGITLMTLVGGFASTVFIPLTHWLIEFTGWRDALLVLAGANIVLCALPHFVTIPGPHAPRSDPPPRPAPAEPGSREGLDAVLHDAAFWCFVAASVLQGIVAAGLPIHLIPLLGEKGLSLETAVLAFAAIGPAQVAARLAMGLGERALGMTAIGLLTLVLWALAFLILPGIGPGSPLVLVFAVVYGASNGMMTIVRAVLPPELFGRAHYGAVQGLIATPVRLASAAAPFLFGALWSWWGGYGAVIGLCLAMALCSLGFFVLIIALRKGRASPDDPLA